MLIVRGTKKLRDRIRHAPVAGADDTSTTELGDWFATVLFWKPQVVLLVNARTYLPVILPYAPGVDLTERIPDAIADILTRHGTPADFVAAEGARMDEVRVAPTNSRRVLGVMNEFTFVAERHRVRGSVDLGDLSLRLAGMLLGPLFATEGSPDRELAAVVADAADVDGRPDGSGGHGGPISGSIDDVASVIPLRPGDGPVHPEPSRPTPTPAPAAVEGARRRSKMGETYRLKITLKNTKPPIWRRVLVDGSATLDHLHEVIQARSVGGTTTCTTSTSTVAAMAYPIPTTTCSACRR